MLLINLGTPASPKVGDVRRFLREFLSDPRVVEIPRLIWWPILYGVVLTLRPRKTAAKYEAIWTDEGSPLMTISWQQAQLLRGYLGDRGTDVDVALAMRYGEPSIASVIQQLRPNTERILVLPMYPQYSKSTTASAFDAVNAALRKLRHAPELRFIESFHDHRGYIDALKRSVLNHWQKNGVPAKGERLVISFHGVPKRTVERGDPYHDQCQQTGHLLAQALGLRGDDYLITFQSRFGRAEWLQPYTAPTLRKLAEEGAARVD
ncbi:MAG: ferrochelatase, partial [Burkholderiaceae bacterium]